MFPGVIQILPSRTQPHHTLEQQCRRLVPNLSFLASIAHASSDRFQ